MELEMTLLVETRERGADLVLFQKRNVCNLAEFVSIDVSR